MKNKGYLQDTGSFKIYFYALDSVGGSTTYPIARQESGLVLQQSSFSVGSITSFALTAVDTSEIQKFTTYQVTINPGNSIPNES